MTATPIARITEALDRVRELRAAAMPGPWMQEPPSSESWPQSDESIVTVAKNDKGWRDTVISGWGYDASGLSIEAGDVALILALTHPAVLDAVEAVLTDCVRVPQSASRSMVALADAILATKGQDDDPH